jgi:phage shock protein C
MGLYRSKDKKMIAGVCGGLAEALDWDPTIVRILYVVLSICSTAFPGIVVYLVLWFAMPEEEEVSISRGQDES